MNKIYLATLDIENKENILAVINKKFKDKCEIIAIPTQQELHTILYSEFKYCIIDHSILEDISIVEHDRLQGDILYLAPGLGEDDTTNIKLFGNITELTTWIRVYSFANETIKNVNKNKPQKNNNTKLPEKLSTPSEDQSNNNAESKDLVEEVGENKLNVPSSNNAKDEQIKVVDESTDEGPSNANPLLPDIDPTVIARIKEKSVSLHTREDDSDLEDEVPEKYHVGKKSFENYKGESKAIGIWSPIAHVGITQFTSNFSVYLGKFNFKVSVVEGLTRYPNLKMLIKRCSKEPKDWVPAYGYCVLDSISSEDSRNIHWSYSDVYWYPLEDAVHRQMPKIEKYDEFLKFMSNNFKYTFFTLENYGEMSEYNIETLKYLDELWIVLDNSYDLFIRWKNYIKNIAKDNPHLKVKIILNRYNEESYEQKIKETTKFPIIAKIPSLDEMFSKNMTQPKTAIEYDENFKILETSFHNAAVSLIGKDYKKLKPFRKPKNIIEKIKFVFQ